VRLVLASASPRRAELLRAAGIDFEVLVANVDETSTPGESPESYVQRLAEEKASAVIAEHHLERPPVLGADTVVVLGHTILGKPTDETDARRMLGMLSGRTHRVVTGVCLYGPGDTGPFMAVDETTVEFSALTAAEMNWYLSSGEPFDKAGAYAIQGLGSRFIASISGSYTNVVGLPIPVVYDLCKKAGILIS
jgi:septum formation protein